MLRKGSLPILILALLLTACGQQEEPPAHTHTWDAANCLRGELCWSCKETRGEALGHDWTDATCAKAEHCSRCGKSEGNPLPHTSDGNGACTVCKQELNSRILLDGARPENKFIVYDGVVLSFPLFVVSERKHNSGIFGKEYRIYDQVGTLVAQGEWVQEFYTSVKTDTGWYDRYYHDTDYIPLSPGTYCIEYSCYAGAEKKDNGNKPVYAWDKYLVPDGELLHCYNMLEVH